MAERRDSYRFPVDEREGAVFLRADRGEWKLVDLSSSGVGLLAPADWADKRCDLAIELHVGDGPPLDVLIEPVRRAPATAATVRLGGRLGPLDPGGLRQMGRYLRGRQMARDRRFVERALGPLVLSVRGMERTIKVLLGLAGVRKRPLWVDPQDGGAPIRLGLRGPKAEAQTPVLLAEVPAGDGQRLATGRTYEFAFPGNNGLARFRASCVHLEPGQLGFACPELIETGGFRAARRVRLGSPLALRAPHPRLVDRWLYKPVRDVSGFGLSFKLRPDEDLLMPGDCLRQVAVELPDGPIEFSAAVRSFEPIGDGELACGLQILDFASEAQAERWGCYVFSQAHPYSRLGDRQLVDTTHQVLQTSGFFAEVTQALLPSLTERYFRSWARQSENSRCTRFYVVELEGKAVGTMAANLLYPGTWMVHHFGIDEALRGSDRRGFFIVALELYRAMIYLLNRLSKGDHFITYVDADKSWNDYVYGRFLKQYPRPEDYVYDRYSVFKHQSLGPMPRLPASADSLRVVDADSDMRSWLADRLAERLPGVEVEAFALDRERLGLEEFQRSCAAGGYERTRRILVAMDREIPRGALIAETGDEGINTFGLFSRCWFVPLNSDGGEAQAAQAALLHAAAGHYRAAGKPEFIFFGRAEGEDRGQLQDLGFEFVANGLRWLSRCSLLPSYMEFVEQVMGGAA